MIVGSHVDSVPEGGWLDGALGIFAALEVLRAHGRRRAARRAALRRLGRRGGRALRPQPVRLLGVRGHAATPTRCATSRDRDGERLEDVVARYDVDLATRPARGAHLEGARAYLELHIEQGPVLEAAATAAAVSGTVGVERYLVHFSGQAAHAGATPMRHAAATRSPPPRAPRWRSARSGSRHDGGHCTVGGACAATPGVVTAVAGGTEMLLDQRHLDAGRSWRDAARVPTRRAKRPPRSSAARSSSSTSVGAEPTPFHPRLVELARSAVAEAGGGDGPAIPSGPLHDAAEIGRVVPTVMIFSKSSPPVSHTKIEDTPEAELRVAIEAYGRTVGDALDVLVAGDLEAVAS